LYHGFDQRFLITEHVPDNDQLVIRVLGDGYSIFDKKCCRLAVGERLEDQYDVYYARWAAQGYRSASERAMPLIQHVDAVIDKPRGGYRRQRYARVIVPYQQGGPPATAVGLHHESVDGYRRLATCSPPPGRTAPLRGARLPGRQAPVGTRRPRRSVAGSQRQRRIGAAVARLSEH
jgi:hypothetical protein